MKQGSIAVIAALCLLAGCAQKATETPSGSPSGSGNVGAVMKLTPKNGGPSFDIPVPPSNGKPVDVKGLDDLMAAFNDVCLTDFPDDQKVAAKASAKGYVPLTDTEIHQVLHNDPGRGWHFRQNDSVVILTIELPPFHACGVRTMLPTEPDIGMILAMSVGLWGATQAPPERLVVAPVQATTMNGIAQEMHMFGLLGPDGRPIEGVGAYFAHYPNMQQVELRIVRMRGNNPH